VGTRVIIDGLSTFLLKSPEPNVVYVATVEPSAAVRLKVNVPRPGADIRAPVSVLCRRCYIAVNGGFFTSTGAPVPGQEPDVLKKLLNPITRSSVTTVQWLLKDGDAKPLADDDFTNKRHPRTFIFGNESGTMWFGAVDGRQPGHSIGMTLPEVVSLVREIGATWAVNLDGGCSTTFVVQGVVKNRPCQDSSSVDGERPVANAFVVLRPKLRR
jgi:exopolysaccharide biosynthesis protein